MSVKLYPYYSSEVGTISLNLKDGFLLMNLFDKEHNEISVISCDKNYFKKHLKIVSQLGNAVEIDTEDIDNPLNIYHRETDDTLIFSYKRFSFELDKEKANELFSIYLD